MSLTTGLIAIKGQHMDAVPQIAAAFRYLVTNNDRVLDNWNDVEILINDIHKHSLGDYLETHVFWFRNGWTIMEDMSLSRCTDEAALETISQQLNTPVFSLATQGTSGCYGFWYFDKKKIRSFYNEDGTIADNFGEPLEQEAKYNINESAFYDDVHGVAKEMGIDWEDAENHDHFIAKILEPTPEYKEELRPVVDAYIQRQMAQSQAKKPWWKFW